jgi:hypothetical protein
MPYTNVVIGHGRSAEEALLFARVNQICCDRGIKSTKISNKTEFIEIPSNIKELESASNKIKAVYFAHAYHRYLEEINSGTKDDFSESEYKYYSILIKKMGRKEFRRMMSIYEGKEPNTCIAIKENSEYYKFMY